MQEYLHLVSGNYVVPCI